MKPKSAVRPPFDQLSLDGLIGLLSNGYSDEVRAFTKSIQANPFAVSSFERLFDWLIDTATIDWKGSESQVSVEQRASETSEELDSFLSGMSRPCESFVLVQNHGHEITVETGWVDELAGETVWDRWTVDVDDPVMAYVSLTYLFDHCAYEIAAKPVEKPAPPLYRYHPERFKAYRDYAEPVGKMYRQRVDPVNGMLTLEQVNEVLRHVREELNRRSLRFPRKLKEHHPSPSLVFEAENDLATAYGRFVQAGRQVMDFPPMLTEMLAETDVDDIPLNSIKLPYAAQYLHFGPQPGLEIEPGWLVDGAYVEMRGAPGDVRFTVTAAPSDPAVSAQWYLFPEVQYSQDFVGDFRSMDLGTAIDTVLSERLTQLMRHRAGKGGDMSA